MANVNKVFLIGRLTRDPELRYGSSGGAICKFGLATNRQWRSQSGEKQEETCFVDLVVFGRQAETCNEYLSKGRPVFVEGRLSFSTWEDRESGARRSKLEVVGERVQFLGSRDNAGGGGGFQQRENGGQSNEPAPAHAPAPSPSAPAGGNAPAGIDYDDIPF